MSIIMNEKSATASMISFGRTRHNNMHEFIKAVQEYCSNRTDESCGIINRHLQLLSVSIDTSIFDPNTSVVCEFFVSMYELLKHVEPRSSLSWGCINVLIAACRNPAARHSLIHIYQFVPLISRFLGDHLPMDKKIPLLNLIQELSCGLNISWIIPNLEHLMSTLTRWVLKERSNEEIVLLSLGIIVNLCNKNLPATYMLTKCVDIKNFLKVCSSFKGVKLEACTCKLFIILECVEGYVPDAILLKLIDLTFLSIRESFLAKDPIVLRQNVEFYLNVEKDNKNVREILQSNDSNNDYEENVRNLLQVIRTKQNVNASGDNSGPTHDPECMSLMFKFLRSIVEKNVPKLETLYESIAQIALAWIQTDWVSTDALLIIRSIYRTSATNNARLLELLLPAIPVFTTTLQHIDGDSIMNIEQCKRLIAVMDLLKTLILSVETRQKVMEYLTKDTLCKVFTLMSGEDDNRCSPRERANDANNSTPEAFSLYINTLCLIGVIAKYHKEWTDTLRVLLDKKQIHAVLAEGIYNGDSQIRTNILNMVAGVRNFPCEAIARTMAELQPVFKMDSQHNNSNRKRNLNDTTMVYPLLTSHTSAPDEAIRLLNEARSSQRINISTCDVMELYEYKLATMGHAERAAMASVEAASQRCTHLQHQTAQLTAELSRIRQLFLHTQQVQKECENTIVALNCELGQLKGERALRKDAQLKLENSCKRIDELVRVQQQLEAEKTKAVDAIPPLEKLLKKLEKNGEYKDQMIAQANSEITFLKERLKSTEIDMTKELQKKTKESEDLTTQLYETRSLLEKISQLTNGKRK